MNPTCSKMCFASEKAVKRFYRGKRWASRVRPYFCKVCRAYHATTNNVRYEKEIGQWQ